MKRARKPPNLPLATLKFEDLVRVDQHPEERRLVNLKVPADVLIRVHHLAHQLNVTKTAAVIALLNEGLTEAHRRGVGVKKVLQKPVPPKRLLERVHAALDGDRPARMVPTERAIVMQQLAHLRPREREVMELQARRPRRSRRR